MTVLECGVSHINEIAIVIVVMTAAATAAAALAVKLAGGTFIHIILQIACQMKWVALRRDENEIETDHSN